MPGKIRSGLTRLYAKERGGVTETSEYTARGVTRTVFWFRDESKRMGDYSPLGTLLMNEQAKDDFSEDVVDYVFLHEVGHDQMGFIGRTLFWVFYLTFGLLFFAGIGAFPITLVAAFQFAPSLATIPIYMAVTVGGTLAAVLPIVAVCWIDEALAERFAISKLGRSHYQSVLEEIKAESDAGPLHKIRLRIQYPPDSLVLWIVRRRGIGNE